MAAVGLAPPKTIIEDEVPSGRFDECSEFGVGEVRRCTLG